MYISGPHNHPAAYERAQKIDKGRLSKLPAAARLQCESPPRPCLLR